jgi:hypothetical protein
VKSGAKEVVVVVVVVVAVVAVVVVVVVVVIAAGILYPAFVSQYLFSPLWAMWMKLCILGRLSTLQQR